MALLLPMTCEPFCRSILRIQKVGLSESLGDEVAGADGLALMGAVPEIRCKIKPEIGLRKVHGHTLASGVH